MMEVKRIKQINFIWLAALLLTSLCRSQNIPKITNLHCINDYQTKMSCFWEIVGSSSNCSEDFTLTYRDLLNEGGTCPDLQNEPSGGSTVPNKCICNIDVRFFVSSDIYFINLTSHGLPVGHTETHISDTVKPIPPSNVRIDFQEEQNALVQWNTGYEGNFIETKLSFHVQILFKHSREVAKEDFLTQLEPRYIFNKRQLERGEDYVVRVRTKPADNLAFEGYWSEWSSEAQWKNGQNIPKITNLHCINDYQTKMSCFWEIVGSSRNCSEDFTLTYRDLLDEGGTCPDLQNEPSGGSTVPNKCICNIDVRFFVSSDIYFITLTSHGYPVGHTETHISDTVKPGPPSNVRIDFQEEQNALVQWNTGYEGNFIETKLSFHVQILFKHSREVAKEDFLTQLEPRYTFSNQQLKRGEDYVVRVRTKPADNQAFEGYWSEWSSEAQWKNDYSLTLKDLKKIIIPITCIVMVCLIIVNYVCFIRYKRKWWNNIPNPAKSKLAQSKLLQKQPLNPVGKTGAKTSCESFFTRIVKAHKSKCGQLSQLHNAEEYVNISGGYYLKKVFFEPEDEDIERCVKIYLKKENEIQAQENKMEIKAEDPLLEPGDLSIAKMFFDILCDSSGVKVDTLENCNPLTSFDCSGWMNSSGKKETQRCNSNVSAYRESGYGSDHSPMDFLSDIDKFNTSYFGQWPDNESTPYTPSVSVEEKYLHQKEESPGYNSFAKSLYDAKKDLITDTSETFCLGSLSNNIVLTPKSILYYNTKSVMSHNNEDSFQSIIRPKPQQFLELTLKSHERKSDPSICYVSGYQSFDQAVQEDETDFGCHMSGYKSFEQAVEDEPDCECRVYGYQSFDQAVQQGDGTSVCQVTGYQSFDRAVQQNETSESNNCSVVESAYKPLEDLILQNSEYKVEEMLKNDRQSQLGESHNNAVAQQIEKSIDVTDTSNNKAVTNSQKTELLSSGLRQICLEDFESKKKYLPSKDFSDKSIQALKIAVDSYLDNHLAVKHELVPFTLTFDICEHLRKRENMHGHKSSLDGLILPCHLDEVQFLQEQLTISKHLTSPKCPSTTLGTFENLSYFVPLCDFEAVDSSQQSKHELVQQMNVDKEGNSYMKLVLPEQDSKICLETL